MDILKAIKKNSKNKSIGDKSHLFAKLVKNFETGLKEKESNLEINLQNISNRKYLKLYRIDSNLVNYETNTLENSLILIILMMKKIFQFSIKYF